MKSIKEKKLKRILALTLTATSMQLIATNIVCADNNNNTVNVTSSNYEGGNIFAGYTESGNTTGNRLTVSNITSQANQIDAGFTYDGNASDNITNINNVFAEYAFIHGGYACSGNGNAFNNVLNFYGGTAYEVHGGHANIGDAINNAVNFYDGTVSNEIGAGYSNSGNVNYNTLNLYGGVINGATYGGRASYGGSGSSGDAIGNVTNIYGGTVKGNIYGGWAPNGSANDNTINVYGTPNLTNANLYAGNAANTMVGNSLNFYTKGITALNIYGFQYLNFYLPDDISNGNGVLTLTNGTTDLSNTRMSVSSSGNSNLKTGDTITLLNNTNGINIGTITLGSNEHSYTERFDAENNTIGEGTLSKGISEDFDLTLSRVTDSSGNVTGVTATVGEGSVTTQKDAIAAPNTTPVLIVNNHIPELPKDLVDSFEETTGVDTDSQAKDVVDNISQHGYEIFFNMGGGHLKYKTGNGSYVKTNSGGYDLGFARKFQMSSSVLTFAPVFEYGHASFDSYYPNVPNDIKGYGHSIYTAGGFITRVINNSGFYYEGSLRGGRSDNRYASDDFLVSGNRTHVDYHTEAPIFMGHIRIGNMLRMDRDNLLDIYGIYSYSRQNSSSTNLSSGEHYNFSSVDSSRFKAGYRLTSRLSRISQLYSGLAYQYDTSADSTASNGSISTKSSGQSGSSGMLELGWLIKPLKNNPWVVDVNTTGWIGLQKGVTAMAKIKKAF